MKYGMAVFIEVFLDDSQELTLEAMARHRTQKGLPTTVRQLVQEAVDLYVEQYRRQKPRRARFGGNTATHAEKQQ